MSSLEPAGERDPEPRPEPEQPEPPVVDDDAPVIDPPLASPADPPELFGGEGRRYPSTIGGMFYLGVLAATAIGLGIVATGDWRVGTRWLAGGLILAAVVRLVLPARDAGMLAVRHRVVDCAMLAGVGAALILLAATIPNQPV